MTTYNHLFAVAFSVSGSTHPKGEDVTPGQFRAAVMRRLGQLSDSSDEWFEAVGEPEDTFVEEPDLLEFTVLGYVEETGSIFCEHVEALDDLSAFQAAAKDNEHITFVAVLPGHLNEGAGINFPGTGVVDATTVLEQPEVFG